jgi:DNA-binding MarR family transcriptional regulator
MSLSNSPWSNALTLGEILRGLGREIQLLDRNLCSRHSLSPAQWHALHEIADSNRLGMNELAEHLRISRSTLTRIVDQLERKELVRRIPDPSDRRHTRLESTPAGQRLHDELLEDALFTQQTILRELPRHRWAQTLESLRSLQAAVHGWTARHADPSS